MIAAKLSSVTSPFVPMWITTMLPSRPAARSCASIPATLSPCRLSAASTTKPSASSCDLAPSITDSPIAIGGRWSSGSVVLVVVDVDVDDVVLCGTAESTVDASVVDVGSGRHGRACVRRRRSQAALDLADATVRRERDAETGEHGQPDREQQHSAPVVATGRTSPPCRAGGAREGSRRSDPGGWAPRRSDSSPR